MPGSETEPGVWYHQDKVWPSLCGYFMCVCLPEEVVRLGVIDATIVILGSTKTRWHLNFSPHATLLLGITRMETYYQTRAVPDTGP